jgi:chaperone modulatory protein CbpM
MSEEEPIPLELYCQHEELDITFVQALSERGLIQVTVVQERTCIAPAQVARLEQLARLHQDLDINLEGLEAISHMLERMERMQREMRALEERLRVYERE